MKKLYFLITLVIVFAMTLSGCFFVPPEEEKYEIEYTDKINEYITQDITQKTDENQSVKLEKFEILGIHEKLKASADYFAFTCYGVAHLSNNNNAFVTAEYGYNYEKGLDWIDRFETKEDYFTAMEGVIEQSELFSVYMTEVTDISDTQQIFLSNAPTPFKEGIIQDGFVYELSKPVFDDDEKSISFEVKTLLELGENNFIIRRNLAIGFNAQVLTGVLADEPVVEVGAPPVVVKNGCVIVLDKYTFTVGQEEYNKIKADSKLAYDYVAQAITEEDHTKIKAERMETLIHLSINSPSMSTNLVQEVFVQEIEREFNGKG